jgi:O-Antigen ligase.
LITNSYIKNNKTKKNTNIRYLLSIIAIGAICLMRIYRNSVNNASTQVGGIWNIISFIFFVLLIYNLIIKHEMIFSSFSCMNVGILFCLVTTLNAVINLNGISIYDIYKLGIISYYVAITVVLYLFSVSEIGNFEKKITIIIFYIILIFTGILLIMRTDRTIDMIIYQSDIYFPLCLFPIVLLWYNKKKIIIPIICMGIVIIFSNKRTAIIAFVIGLIIYYISHAIINKNVKMFFSTLVKVSLSLVIIFAIYNIISKNFNINLFDRLLNMAEDGGSGRDDIYAGIIETMLGSELYYWVFGYGLDSLYNIYGRSSGAHNDFLHLLYQYGVFSSMLLLGFYLSLIKLYINMLRNKYLNAGAFGFSITVSLMLSMFSIYTVSDSHISGMGVFWGVILCDYKKYLLNKSVQEKNLYG